MSSWDVVRASVGVPDARSIVLEQLRDILEHCAGANPLLLMLDDLQWADQVTLLAIRVLGRQLSSCPIVWALARRPYPTTPALDRTLREMTAADGVVIHLEPLGPDAVADMATDALGAPPDASLMTLLSGASGNPFYVTQLLRVTTSTGEQWGGETTNTARHDGLPVQFRTTVDAQLRSLPEPLRQLLDLASVFGRRFRVVDLATMCNSSAAALAPLLQQATQAGLLVDDGDLLAFHHDLVRLAICDELPAALRPALHREAASAILANGGSVVDAAPHLSLGAQPGDAHAMTTLRDAAEQLSATSPAAAAALYERMLELSAPGTSDRVELAAALIMMLAFSGRPNDALAVPDRLVADGLSKSDEAVLLMAAAHAAETTGRHPLAQQLVERVLDSPELPEQLRSRCTLLAAVAATFAGATDRGERVAGEVVHQAERLGDHEFQVHALVVLAHIAARRGLIATSLDLVRRAEAAEQHAPPQQRHGRPALTKWATLFLDDRFAEARSAIEVGAAVSSRLGLPGQALLFDEAAALVLLGEGRLEEATASARTTIEDAEALDLTEPTTDLLHLLALVQIHTGALGAARRCATRIDALIADGATLHGFGRSTAAARLVFAGGAAGDAVTLLADVYDDPHNLLMHQMTDIPFVPQLVRIAQAAGVPTRAAAARDAAHTFAARNPETESIVGAAVHAEGLADGDVRVLRDAVEHYRRSPRPMWLAVGLEDLAVAFDAPHQRAEAIALLDEAMTLFSDHGATTDADRVRARLRHLGVRRRPRATRTRSTTGWDSLSPAERKVAELASEGLSNREIADRLFNSPHTVNAHLNHIFVKLGIHSRVELAARRSQRSE